MISQRTSNYAGKMVHLLVIITCLSATNLSLGKGFGLIEDGVCHSKQVNSVPDITWDSSSFCINGQRMAKSPLGWDPYEEFDFDINVKIPPVETFTVKANVISVESHKPRTFIEDIYFED